MTNHPRRDGRRKHQRRAAELFARGPKPRPAWAIDSNPGQASSVRFYLATVTTPPKENP